MIPKTIKILPSTETAFVRLNERGEIIHDNDELLSASEAVLSHCGADVADLNRLERAVTAMRLAHQQAEAKAKGETG